MIPPHGRAALIALLLLPAIAAAQGGFGAPEAAPTGVRRALVIGIDRYDDPKFPALRFARADAELLAGALRDARYGGFNTVDLLVEGDLSAQAVLDRVLAFGRTIGPDDFALIYFSGHGTRWVDERNRSHAFLATSDTRRDDPLGTAVPLEALQDAVQNLAAPRRALILDACLTGDGKLDSEDATAIARALVDEKAPFAERSSDKEAHLFATTWGKPALESRTLGHGLYTWHLVQALTERFDEADLNQDLVVSASEAHDHARDRTMAATSAAQVPMAFYKVVGREELVLSGDPRSRRRVEAALITAYSGPQEGIALVVDGEERGAFPRSVLVDPGYHTVEFRTASGKVIDRGRFRFARETAYDAARLRDALNGGRHRLLLAYAHLWMPGVAHVTDRVPSGPGGRLGYGFRLPGRDPVLRRFGADLDVALHGFAPIDPGADGWAEGSSPPTLVWDLGVGPTVHIDLPYAAFSVRPRFGAAGIQRLVPKEDLAAPYYNWVFGTVGADLGFAVRPTNRVGIGARYTIAGHNMPLRGDFRVTDPTDDDYPTATIELMHRLSVGVELGF